MALIAMDLTNKIAVLAFFSLFAIGATAAVTVEEQSIDPEEVEENETIDNQLFTIEAEDVVSDGDTVEVTFEFTDELEIQPNEVNILSEVAEIDQSAEINENNTVSTEISADAEVINPVLELDTSVTYPENFEQIEVLATVNDAEGETDSATLTVNAETEDEEAEADGEQGDTDDTETEEEETTEEDEDTNGEQTEDEEIEESQEQDEESTQQEEDETGTNEEEETEETTEEDEDGIIASIVDFFSNLF